MFADTGEDEADGAPQNQADGEHGKHRADAPGLHCIVWQTGLNQPIEIQLLAQRLAARRFERRERSAEQLIGELQVDQEPVDLRGVGAEGTVRARDLGGFSRDCFAQSLDSVLQRRNLRINGSELRNCDKLCFRLHQLVVQLSDALELNLRLLVRLEH